MAVRWKAEPFPMDDDPDVPVQPDPPHDYHEDGGNAANDVRRRLDGARVRNALMAGMPPRNAIRRRHL